MDAEGNVHPELTIAGGVFGLLAAFLAWYNALAGIADTSNRYAFIFACVVNLSALREIHPPLRTDSLSRDDAFFHFAYSACLLTLVLHSFFIIPVAHFPWSEKGREKRGLTSSKDHTA